MNFACLVRGPGQPLHFPEIPFLPGLVQLLQLLQDASHAPPDSDAIGKCVSVIQVVVWAFLEAQGNDEGM